MDGKKRAHLKLNVKMKRDGNIKALFWKWNANDAGVRTEVATHWFAVNFLLDKIHLLTYFKEHISSSKKLKFSRHDATDNRPLIKHADIKYQAFPLSSFAFSAFHWHPEKVIEFFSHFSIDCSFFSYVVVAYNSIHKSIRHFFGTLVFELRPLMN